MIAVAPVTALMRLLAVSAGLWLVAPCPGLAAEGDELLDRPLFAMDRRAAAAPVVHAVNPDPKLTGVVLRAGVERALFAAPEGTGEGQALAVGDRIDGWRIDAIAATSVRMDKGGRVMSMQPLFAPARQEAEEGAPDDIPTASVQDILAGTTPAAKAGAGPGPHAAHGPGRGH